MKDGSNRVVRHLSHLKSVSSGDINATTILLLESNLRQGPVKSDAEAFKFPLNNTLIGHGLLTIKHDQNERAGSANTDNLLTTTFTIFGTLNDTWQIKQLNLSASVVVHTWNTSQRCKLIVSNF